MSNENFCSTHLFDKTCHKYIHPYKMDKVLIIGSWSFLLRKQKIKLFDHDFVEYQ